MCALCVLLFAVQAAKFVYIVCETVTRLGQVRAFFLSIINNDQPALLGGQREKSNRRSFAALKMTLRVGALAVPSENPIMGRPMKGRPI